MLRYHLIKFFYPVLSLLAQFYFFVINSISAVINSFKPKRSVQWTEDELSNELLFISAKQAAEKIRRKQISSEQLVTTYINRIKSVQPFVNAVVAENFEAALDEAKKIDNSLAGIDENSDEYHNLANAKPLLGVPFTVKNNIDVKGFVTSAACKKYISNSPAVKDGIVVEKLRNAGAIPVALTNLPKLAMNWTCENEIYGRTCNPYDLRRIPGGSSGGEGAIIASAGSLFGLGNDLGGSVRIPALMCGVFGLKPTKHVVPLDGMVPEITTDIGKDQWAIGPLCRYAEDLPLVFGIIAGKLPSDLDIAVDFNQIHIYYMENLNTLIVEKTHSDMRQALENSVHFFETEFNVTAQKVDFPLAHHFYELWGGVGFSTPAKSTFSILAEFPQILNASSDLTSASWLHDIVRTFVEPRNDQEKKFMLQKYEKLRHQVVNLLGKDGLLLLPAWPSVAPFNGQSTFTMFNLTMNRLFGNLLGFPSLVCPVGLSQNNGMPVGVQIVGPPHSEPLLIAAAKEIEKHFGGWIRPRE
ncbi:amidase domain-containing protein [Ditylenchus destructor]|uniref:Amidase domain-containing protein n=1 Tax=Ditylenchus destructor TaxID=166010 RepID=A0AAD4N7I9_9BILA|nr:amidase domain-containing protein [Ditylenchus destructor]